MRYQKGVIGLLWHELKEWLSHPVRLAVLDGSGAICYGILRSVDYAHCTVDLSDPPPAPIAGAVRGELLSSSHLLRFLTEGEMARSDPRQVILVMTDQIEVVQRRHHPRIEADLPVWLQVLPPTQDAGAMSAPLPVSEAPHARAVNISAGGLAMLTSRDLSPGDRLKLTLTVDERVTLTDVLARVTRTQPQAHGTCFAALQFEQLSVEVLEVLSHIVARSLQPAAAHQQFGRVLRKDA